MSKSTVLVVDDEAFFRHLYTELLSDAGYLVEAASSGEEALTRLRQGGVDVVLTDMVMPGLSGLDLLRESRSVENPPDVVLVTGHATMETAIQALKNGARDYLVKPFNPGELLHLVRTCLEQRRLLDENALLKNQIRLYQAGQSLASLLEIDRLIPQAITTLLREVGQGRGFAFLFENAGVKLLEVQGLEKEEAEALSRSLFSLVGDLSGMRMFRGDELKTDSAWPKSVRTLFLFPLHSQDELKGVLVILNPVRGDFQAPIPTRKLLFIFEQAALGFDNAYRYLGARELMYTDDLTGLYNYRYLHSILDQELRRGERYGFKFSVVFIDLDRFKEINDAFGHLVGSATLKEIGRLLRLCVREVDLLFRYGGDEFTALLVETDRKGAAIVAERIRQTIEEHTFKSFQNAPFRLTATVGYATFPEDARDKEKLIDLADRAMYLGKQTRNVIRWAGEIVEK